jgi:hypothetical protein
MKKIFLTALLVPVMALAQTYPAPTFSGLTLQSPLTAANGGTGSTTSTGTGSAVLSNSPALITPNLGTPSAVTLTNGTGLPISSGVSGLGTGVATALSNAVTGSGGAVLGTSPTISSPAITGGTINNASVGATTRSTGAFTSLGANGGLTVTGGSTTDTLTSTGTVSGAGFTNYFASPPAIGGTAPNAGSFTTLGSTGAASLNSLALGGGAVNGSYSTIALANTANPTTTVPSIQYAITDNGTATPDSATIYDFYINAVMGSSSTASHQAFTAQLTGAYGATDDYFVASSAFAFATGASGQYFGSNPYVKATSAAASTTQVVGEEINTDVENASVARKVGLQIVDVAASTGTSSGPNAGLLFVRQAGAAGFGTGIQFGDDTATNSGEASVAFIRAGAASGAATTQRGIDFRNATFSSSAIDLPSSGSGTGAVTWGTGAGGGIYSATVANGPSIVYGNNLISFEGTFVTSPTVMTIDTSANRVNAFGMVTHNISPTTAWGSDYSGSTVTIANGSSAALAAGNGMIIVEDSVTSQSAMYLCSSGVCVLGPVVGTTWVAPTTTPASGHMSVNYSGSAYTIYNNQGASETVTVGGLRLHSSN